jgi:hypothetical protein
MAFMDVIARYQPQVLITGILIKPITKLRPADPIIEFAHLLLGVFHLTVSATDRGG